MRPPSPRGSGLLMRTLLLQCTVSLQAVTGNASQQVPATLSAGQATWTPKQLRKGLKKHALVMVGFSGTSGGDFTRQFEPHYAALVSAISNSTDPASSHQLRQNVYFVRMDADRHKSTAARYNVDTLPTIYTFQGRKSKPVKYTGVHHRAALLPYAHKLAACAGGAKSAVPVLRSQEAVLEFLKEAHPNETALLGFFGGKRDVDDYADWREAAARLCLRHDVWPAQVEGEGNFIAALARKPWRWYTHLPALVLFRKPDASEAAQDEADRTTTPAERAVVQLSTLTEGSIERWVDSNAIPHLGRLEPATWHQYEQLGLPMAMLFLSTDVRSKMTAVDRFAMDALRAIAPRYRTRVTFLYGHGGRYREKMKLLGLYDSKALPALAMNTGDGRVLPYREARYDELGMESWIRSFLGLSAAELTKGVKRAANSPKPPKPMHGITGDAHADAFAEEAKHNVTSLTRETLRRFVQDPYRDVLLVLIAHDSAPCQQFYKFVKRAADRFIELGIITMAVAKFDVQRHVMPPSMGLQYTKLPAVLMLPAKDKELPYRYLSGKAKAQHLMWFAQEHASYKFELPPDPHLTREMHLLKLKQIKEHEEWEKAQPEKAASLLKQDL